MSNLTEHTAAAIVTYNPEAYFPQRLREIRSAVGSVVVVDNSNQPESQAFVAAACAAEAVPLIQNKMNLGIATALNTALDWAIKNDYEWLLTLDQDSSIRPGILRVYQDIFDHAGRDDTISGIGILIGRQAERCRSSLQSFMDVEDLITSGTLMKVQAAQQAGGFWDGLFIDWVDLEMCVRLRRLGFRLIGTTADVLQHKIGSGRPVNILGIELMLTEHPPLRRYYMARNRLLISRRHHCPVNWYILIREGIVSAVFEENSIEKLLATIHGVWAGLIITLPNARQ